MDGRIFDLLNNFLEHLDHDWPLREMATSVELSISRFPILFKAEAGMSLGAYLKELRLEGAQELLESTYLQTKQIGILVGMSKRHGL